MALPFEWMVLPFEQIVFYLERIVTDGRHRSNVCKTILNGLKNIFNFSVYRLNGY